MAGDILKRSAAVERRLSTLARSLYAAEKSLELAFVRSQKDVEGPAGQMASEVLQTLADVWAMYPLARDVVQQIGSSIAHARLADAQRLLRPDSLTLPTGAAIGAEEFLVALQEQLDQMVEGTKRLADRARRALASLDATTAAFAERVERAAALEADHDVEIGEARRQVDRAVAAVAAEPTVEPAPKLERFDSFHPFLLKATAAHPDDRFQTADEMADQLPGVLREVVALTTGIPRPAPPVAFGPVNDDQEIASLAVDPTDPAATFLTNLVGDGPRSVLRASTGTLGAGMSFSCRTS